MIPVMVDPALVDVGLVAAGPEGAKRLAWLNEAGVRPVVYAPAGDLGPSARANRLPDVGEIAAFRLLFAAGLPRDSIEPLARQARAAGVLINVEDVNDLCDFHVPALVRRGDLLLTVSTGGHSPALAGLIRRRLAELFPADWAARLARLGMERRRMRANGVGGSEIGRAVALAAEREGWFR